MKKKLLIAADTYFPKKDGVVRFLKEVVPRLQKQFKVTLIVPNFEGKKIEVKGTNVKIIKLPVSKYFSLSGYPSIKVSRKNKKTIKDEVKEADVVFAQDLAMIGYFSIKYAKKYKKSIFAFIHQINWEQLPQVLPKSIRNLARNFIKKFSAKIYNKCNLLAIPYKELGEELKKQGIKAKMEVVRLGIDSDFFSPTQDKVTSKNKVHIDPKFMVIGYVGRISKEKNLEVLAETFQKLQPHHKIFLLIVGGGSEMEMKKLEAVKNAKVTGFVSNVVPYLQAMDIFVMPSLTETTSLATLEAMSCGIPVITTKVGFLKEYVIKDHNGLLFPKGNAYTLGIQLKKMLENPELRKRLGHNGRNVAKSFSWDNSAERFKEIIEEL
ncbi:glycosyltransferase [Nanoarchaeota archaeon]